MTIIVAGWICCAQKRSARRKMARGEGVSLRFGNCVAGWGILGDGKWNNNETCQLPGCEVWRTQSPSTMNRQQGG